MPSNYQAVFTVKDGREKCLVATRHFLPPKIGREMFGYRQTFLTTKNGRENCLMAARCSLPQKLGDRNAW